MCGRCGTIYDPRFNVGRWQCRVHPGTMDYTGHWTCCGVGVEGQMGVDVQRGCRPADHDVDPHSKADELALIRSYMGLPPTPAAINGRFHTLAAMDAFLVGRGTSASDARNAAILLGLDTLGDPMFYKSGEAGLAAAYVIVQTLSRPPAPAMDPNTTPATATALLKKASGEERQRAAAAVRAAFPSLYPQILVVRRFAQDVDLDVIASLPLAEALAYKNLLRHDPRLLVTF